VDFGDPAWLETERAWLSALRRGDRRAFDFLYKSYAQPLYRRVLLPRLGEPAAAEDALAETFRKAFQHLQNGRFSDQGKGLWPYLTTIATNQTHDLHRQQTRQGRALAGFASLMEMLPRGESGEDEAPSLRPAVTGVLARLNARYQRAIELRFMEERSRDECARILEVKLGTFDVLLLRALRAFRQQWQESHGER
jgi:RNA polymerase sigma factor (sigma-70 family)